MAVVCCVPQPPKAVHSKTQKWCTLNELRIKMKMTSTTDFGDFNDEDKQGDPAGFDALAMIEMWEEMDALVKQWGKKYGASSRIASTALKEYASSLIIEKTS